MNSFIKICLKKEKIVKKTMDRRTKYTLKMIRIAMFDLLERKSIDAITVTDICKEADINRGTFYKYYKDVRDLFNQIEMKFTEELRPLFDQSDNPDLENIVQRSLTIICENQDLVRFVQKGDTTSRLVKNILSFIKPYSIEIIQKSQKEISQEKVEYLLEYTLGGITGMIVKWINEDMAMPIDELQDLIMNLANNTLNVNEKFEKN